MERIAKECRPFIFRYISNNPPKNISEWMNFLLVIGLMERDCNNFYGFVHRLVEYHHQYGNYVHIQHSKTHSSGCYESLGVPFVIPKKSSYQSFGPSPPNQNSTKQCTPSSHGRGFSTIIDEKSLYWYLGLSPRNQNSARRSPSRSHGREVTTLSD